MDFNLLKAKGVDVSALYRKMYTCYLLIDCADAINTQVLYDITSRTKIMVHNQDAYDLKQLAALSSKLIRNLDKSLVKEASMASAEKFGEISDKFHEELDEWFKEEFKKWVYAKYVKRPPVDTKEP